MSSYYECHYFKYILFIFVSIKTTKAQVFFYHSSGKMCSKKAETKVEEMWATIEAIEAKAAGLEAVEASLAQAEARIRVVEVTLDQVRAALEAAKEWYRWYWESCDLEN